MASKNITGNCGHSAKYFCSQCQLTCDAIYNLNPETWPHGLTQMEHKAFANAWRDAPSNSAQNKCFKKYSIRWSPLLLLPYWELSAWTIRGLYCPPCKSTGFHWIPVDSSGLQIQFICMVLHTIFGNWTGLESCLSPHEYNSCWNPVDWNPQDSRGLQRNPQDLTGLKGNPQDCRRLKGNPLDC